MKQKILIIIDVSFTERDYKRFGIDILKKKFDVFVFDFTKNFTKKLATHKYSRKTYKFSGYCSIRNISSFIELLGKHKFSNCIDYVNMKPLHHKLIDILKRNNVSIIKIQNGLFVEPEDLRTFIQKLNILILKFTNKKRFLVFIKNKIINLKNMFIKKEPNILYDKVVVTGKVGLRDPRIGLNTKVIYSHTYDYDNYLDINKVPKSGIKKPYAVFIDQYLPFHPDAPIYFGVSPRVTGEKYYPALNDFLNIFEKEYNMDTIVCAHPKSDYESNPKFLYGRKFIRNKTISLIRDCEVVLSHCSAAISYAILLKKPIIFLLSDEYIRSFDNYTPAVLAKKLNSTYFNIDDKNNNSKIKNINLFKVDNKKYKIYKDDYIKYPSSINKKFWKIFNEKI